MAHHIFQLESELQNIPEAAPEASPSFSVSEKLARYGSSALSDVEHLTLLVGRKSVAIALIRHFGSLKGLARASFQELRQFLPRRQAESVVAALSMSVMAETEHTRSEQLDNPESIYRACADMKLFNQEVLSVILPDLCAIDEVGGLSKLIENRPRSWRHKSKLISLRYFRRTEM
jgi:hypothetical protein